MPNTVTNLKLAVAGFLQREPDQFVRTVGADEWDVLLQACNNARLYAERMVDFEWAREQAYVTITTALDGVSLDTAVTYATRNEVSPTACSIKKIITPYLVYSDGNMAPIDHYTKKSWATTVKNRLGNLATTPPTAGELAEIINTPVALIQDGKMVFLSPPTTEAYGNGASVAMDVIKWLTAYSTGAETDFLLDFGFDWMMYRSIHELNYYLKEDERVMISKELVVDSWNALVRWNNELVNSATDDVHLR